MLRRYVDYLVEIFGPQRLMWGSDWPVVNLDGHVPELVRGDRRAHARLVGGRPSRADGRHRAPFLRPVGTSDSAAARSVRRRRPQTSVLPATRPSLSSDNARITRVPPCIGSASDCARSASRTDDGAIAIRQRTALPVRVPAWQRARATNAVVMVTQWIANTLDAFPRHARSLAMAVALRSRARPSRRLRGDRSDHQLRQARIPLGTGAQLAPKYSVRVLAGRPAGVAPLRWKYNHANAPPRSPSDKAARDRATAAVVRQMVVAVRHHLRLRQARRPRRPTRGRRSFDGRSPTASASSAGASIDPSLGAWTYAWYAQNGNERVLFDADVTLSVANVTSIARPRPPDDARMGSCARSRPLEPRVGRSWPARRRRTTTRWSRRSRRPARLPLPVRPAVRHERAVRVLAAADGSTSATRRSARHRAPQTVTLTNSGNAPLSIQTSDASTRPQFKHVAGCTPGTVVMPGASCTMQVQATPSVAGRGRVAAGAVHQRRLLRVRAGRPTA